LDHSFERGLINVSAEYSLGDDGGVKVINRGFDPKGNKWKTALGRAYFTQGQSVGQLKVSFFGPFYGGYNIIELDQAGYSYALVCGPSRSYLWILARTPKLESCFREKLLFRAKELGFETDKLIWVVQQE
jgi:apolipoprotein D and lipocalin family protein